MLELFAPHAHLLRGHDGGMNKTGTMEGVRTLAGYAHTSGHGRVRFVISLTSNDGEMRFRLLRTIESGRSGSFAHRVDVPHALTKVRHVRSTSAFPAETPYLASYRKRVVCKGWVVRTGLRPKIP